MNTDPIDGIASSGSEFIVTFRASPRTRRSEVATLVIYCVLLFLTLAVVTFLLLINVWDIDARDSHSYFWLILLGPAAVALAVAGLWRRRLLFFVGFGETHLQVGENPGRRIPCADIKVVNLAVRGFGGFTDTVSDTVIEFQGDGFRARVRLDPDDRRRCAEVLTSRLPGIRVRDIDLLGDIYFSTDVSQPCILPRRSPGYYRNLAWGSTSIAAFLGLAAATRLCLHTMGLALTFGGWCWVVIAGIVAVVSAFSAIGMFRHARQVAERQAREAESGTGSA